MEAERTEDEGNQRNPADLPLVTLDNNALIALRRNEPAAPAVRKLLEMNRTLVISLNVTISTALEAQRPDDRMEWQDRIAWLETLGIARGNIFTGPRTVGFVTADAPNAVTFDADLERLMNQRIHTILFPNMPFSWAAYRDRETTDLTDTQKQALLELEVKRFGGIYIPPLPTPALDALSSTEREELAKRLAELHRRWFNAKNDALGLYNHISLAWHTAHPEYSVFVTSDGNFRKRTKLEALRALRFRGEILPPAEAVTFLYSVLAPLDPGQSGE
jgi:hypothetical protein